MSSLSAVASLNSKFCGSGKARYSHDNSTSPPNHDSGNRFRDLDIPEDVPEYKTAFQKVRELVLDATFLPWDRVNTLLAHFPSLDTLSMAFNGLKVIPNPLTAPKIRSLSLNSNSFFGMYSLAPLGQLPKLETLTLQSNSISSLSPCPHFPRLVHLDLSDNAIPSLASLNSISPSSTSPLPRPLPSIKSIRLSRNPFFTALPTDLAHILTVARLPQITSLNYSAVSTDERANAELYYLGQIAHALEAVPEGSPAERAVLAAHPLWEDLCRKYERPELRRADAAAHGSVGTHTPGSLGARVVVLRIKARYEALRAWRERQADVTGIEAQREEDGMEEVGWSTKVVRLARGTSVYALLGMVGMAFGILPMHCRLIWETGEWDPVGRSAPRGHGDFDSGAAGPDSVSEVHKTDDNEDRWSVPESDEDDRKTGETVEGEAGKGKWVRREVQLEAGTSSLGFWIEGQDANIRLEVAGPSRVQGS